MLTPIPQMFEFNNNRWRRMVSCKLLTRSLQGLVIGPLHLIRLILVREFVNCGSMGGQPLA